MYPCFLISKFAGAGTSSGDGLDSGAGIGSGVEIGCGVRVGSGVETMVGLGVGSEELSLAKKFQMAVNHQGAEVAKMSPTTILPTSAFPQESSESSFLAIFPAIFSVSKV